MLKFTFKEWFFKKIEEGLSKKEIKNLYKDFITQTNSKISIKSFMRLIDLYSSIYEYLLIKKTNLSKVTKDSNNNLSKSSKNSKKSNNSKINKMSKDSKESNFSENSKESKVSNISDYEVAINYLVNRAKEIIKNRLSREEVSLGDLSRECGLSKELIIKILDDIQEETGLSIVLDKNIVSIDKNLYNFTKNPIEINKLFKKNIKIGLISDTHLGSKYQQLSLLYSAYEEFEKVGVDFVVHSGDLVDGSPNMHVGHLHNMFLHTFEEQVDYCIENYPKSNLFKTYIRVGNHDNSWVKANCGDPVRVVCKKRDDLIYLNSHESAFRHNGGEILVESFHPVGGMPYSLSYRPQKILEATIYNALNMYSEYKKNNKEFDFPKVLAIGHLHNFNYFISAGSHIILLPCFQAQTPYLKEKSLSPLVGFVIIDIYIDDNNNIINVKPFIYDLSSKIVYKDF